MLQQGEFRAAVSTQLHVQIYTIAQDFVTELVHKLILVCLVNEKVMDKKTKNIRFTLVCAYNDLENSQECQNAAPYMNSLMVFQ